MKNIPRFRQLRWRGVIAKSFCASALMTLYSFAVASPQHIVIPSAHETVSGSACVFPDGTSPSVAGQHCYTPAQLTHAYGIDLLHKMGITGKGQTIIVVDSYGSPTQQQDLDTFSDTFGLPRTKIQFIYPDGPYVNPMTTADQQGWAVESALDVQIAHAVAPDATIVNIVTNTDEVEGLTGLPDMFKGIQMAARQYPNSIISMSFGATEGTFTSSDINNYLHGQFHTILEQATQAGITLLASSGDEGSTDYNYALTSLESFPDTDYPTSEPLVTSVGGTWLQAGWRWDPQGTADDYWNCQISGDATCPLDFLNYVNTPDRVTEAVWKEDWLPAGGGGGISKIFQLPLYQLSIGLNNLFALHGQRGVPDIAMNAAVDGGFDLFTSFNAPLEGISGPSWNAIGGTSAASPTMAGVVALAGQEASDILHKNVGVGYLNPILYSLPPSDFNDTVPQIFGVNHQVLLNSNMLYWNANVLADFGPLAVAPVPVPGYPTTKGYDLTTGWGSPSAVNFVNDVARAVVEKNR